MKTLISSYLIFLMSYLSFAQVGIGNTNPQAALDIRSSNQITPTNTDGILIPKADNFPVINPGASQDGMLIYSTGNGAPTKGFYFWDNSNTSWQSFDGRLERIDEGNGFGWRLKDIISINYGTLGNNAVDLSIQSNNFGRGATGSNSFASGQSTLASGNSSFAVNSHNRATGAVSFASGVNTQAIGQYSATFGYYTSALEYTAFAFGDLTTAQGHGSFAGGIHNRAGTYGQTSLGTYSNYISGNTTTFIPTDRLFVLGNGTSTTDRSDALVVLKNGIITAPSFDMSEITDNKALITKEYADVNYMNQGRLDYIDDGNGYGWRLKDINSAYYGAIGNNSVDLSIQPSSLGGGATGGYSVALGNGTFASGSNSTSFGLSTEASGINSTAFGRLTTASGDHSTAFGFNTTASGSISTAFGLITSAIGIASTTFGLETEALGDMSTAFGLYSTAETYGQTSLGIFNTAMNGSETLNIQTDRLLVLGNGTSITNRSDALVVLKNGTITAPSFDLSEITDNKALITKEYADATYVSSGVEVPIVATLNATWSHYSSLYTQPAFYQNNERVYLGGLLRKTGSYVPGETIFTLPVGYRPSARVLAHGTQGSNSVRIDILANGNVTYQSGGLSDFISLEGISFRAN